MVAPDHVAVDIPEQPISQQSPRVNPSSRNDYDNDFFHRVVEDAGRWAFGVIFVEVWVLNSTRTHLIRPESGWWIDPYARGRGENTAFVRLTDPSSPDYLEPEPLCPGVGLPGALWAEVEGGNAANKRRAVVAASPEGFDTTSNRSERLARHVSERLARHVGERSARRVTWREVKPLAEDPDQPYNPRLNFLAESGLGLAAGVPFKVGTSEGLVVYMARENANVQKLTESVNEDYLTHATLLIGSAYALRGPRLAAEHARRSERRATWRRVRAKITAIRSMNQTLESYIVQQEKAAQRPLGLGNPVDIRKVGVSGWGYLTEKIRVTARKCLGAGVRGPPTFTWEQTAWTFFGAFTTLMILTNINVALVEKFGPEYSIVLGPFGALMTLQYGFTAAPGSQPRNAIVGQTISLLIAHGIGQAHNLEPWLKAALATSLAISVMVKCGVPHPPAGAAALLFSSGNHTWAQVGMMLMGNVVAIVCAVFFNNLSDRRQYPTFWGLQPIHDLLFADKEADKGKRKT